VRALAAGALAALTLTAPAAADTLFLKDGRIYEDVKLSLQADLLTVAFEHGQVQVREDRVADYVLSDGGSLGATSAADEEKLAEGLVRFQGRWMPPERRDREVAELIEVGHAAAKERREARLWRNHRVKESKYFRYEYTVSEEVFEFYRDRIEAYYETFDKLWKIRRGDLGKLVVRMYADPEAFYQVTGTPRGVLAFFEWTDPPYRLQFWHDEVDPLASTIVFHEYGHFLQKLIDQDFNYNHWPGESLAEYFSTGSWDERRKRFEVEARVLEGRLIEIQQDMEDGDLRPLETMIREGGERNYTDYTWGWSLVHFLMTDPEHTKNFERFYLGLARDRSVPREHMSVLKDTKFSTVDGDDQWEYFMKCLRLKDQDDVLELQDQWYDHIRELEVSSVGGFAKAGHRASVKGLNHRARRFFEQAIETGEANALMYHRYAEVLDRLGEEDEAYEAWQQAIEMDPFVAMYHEGLGKAKLENGKQTEGRERLKLAMQIDPDDLYLKDRVEELLDGK
jgi:tetratricopeptide (TPR) repeat protein